MLLSLDKNFVFISAGKTGTSSITAALLPHLTTDLSTAPFSIGLVMTTHPEIEARFSAHTGPPSRASLLEGLVMLRAAGAPFEIFVTNEKTGYSLRTSDLNDLRHVPTRLAQRLLGDELWEQSFKFAFVRNPWDWALANYAFKNRAGPVERMDAEKVLWVRDHVSLRQLPVPYRTQHAFLCDEDGEVRLDYVGHFENLARDFAAIADRIELEGRLDHLNENDGQARTDFRRLYTEEAYHLVGELWATDIEAFGYADSR